MGGLGCLRSHRAYEEYKRTFGMYDCLGVARNFGDTIIDCHWRKGSYLRCVYEN